MQKDLLWLEGCCRKNSHAWSEDYQQINVKVTAHRVFPIVSYQDTCNGCKNFFFWRTKVSEAVCKRWADVRSYEFFYVPKFWIQCAMTLSLKFLQIWSEVSGSEPVDYFSFFTDRYRLFSLFHISCNAGDVWRYLWPVLTTWIWMHMV